METIFNKKLVDPMTQPLFLGEPLGLQRYDIIKYQVFADLDSQQQEFNWRPHEIELKKDRSDFKAMSANEQFIFTSNLKYQTMLDSVICRGVSTLLPYVSNTELEGCLIEWQRFEKIHSQSYSYIIQNVYSDASDVFDTIYEDEAIMARAESAMRDYNDLMGMSKDIPFGERELTSDELDELKKQIYMTVISINILEAVRFYVSFICAFAFAENKKMIGNADIIKLIKRDEALHLHNTQSILKIWHENEDEGFQTTAENCRMNAVEMFHSAAEEEKAWAKHLFKDGSIIGLNEKILCDYIDWLCNSRMKTIGLPYETGIKNPVAGWSDSYMRSEAVQTAPQETENTSYKIGASTNDLADMDFSQFNI